MPLPFKLPWQKNSERDSVGDLFIPPSERRGEGPSHNFNLTADQQKEQREIGIVDSISRLIEEKEKENNPARKAYLNANIEHQAKKQGATIHVNPNSLISAAETRYNYRKQQSEEGNNND